MSIRSLMMSSAASALMLAGAVAAAVQAVAQTGGGGCFFGACGPQAPQPQPQSLPQPQTQPAPPPPQPSAGGWQIFENRWVKGSGYIMFRTTSLKDCASICAGDNKCRMFEFYFGKEDGGAKCNLFAHTSIEQGASKESHVAVKR